MEICPTYVVLLNEFAAASHVETKGPKDTLAFTWYGFPSLLMLDVDVERFALQKQFQVGIML